MAKIESSSAENGAVGVAGGTSFIGVLQLLPDALHSGADALVFLAPAVSVLAGFLWKLLRIKLTKRQLNSELQAAIEIARRNRDAIHADPSATQEHKDNAQGAVEQLEHLQFEALRNNYDRIQAHLTEGL